MVQAKSDSIDSKNWIHKLIQGYLHTSNRDNHCHCPLASLVTDVTAREPDVRDAYTKTFKGMNQRIENYTKTYSNCSKETIQAVTAMIIGGLAVARAVNDKKLSNQLLKNCELEALRLLNKN